MVGNILPQKTLQGCYAWHETFITIDKSDDHSTLIEESAEKPVGTKAIDLLKELAFCWNRLREENFKVSLKHLSSSGEDGVITYNDYQKASPIFQKMAHRLMSGYEHAYQTRRGLFKRILDAIYLIFGWKTERDRIHELIYTSYLDKRIFSNDDEHQATYATIKEMDSDSLELEEAKEKPTDARALDVLSRIHKYVEHQYKECLSCCHIEVKKLNSDSADTYEHLQKAAQAINQIAFRILAGYEEDYAKNGLCVLGRLRDGIRLIFNCKSERDKLHKFGYEIYRTLHDASSSPAA